jgi:hypothetical protein|tara:strand:- start:13267 stop:13521 length:255 start_codon:yes stop_codon:yes gene_type:complete
MSKKFMLFSGYHYYPCGGFEDYKGSFETILQAMENVPDEDGWCQIVRHEDFKIVATGEREQYLKPVGNIGWEFDESVADLGGLL